MANHHVAVSRTDENAAGKEQIAGTRFVNFKSATFVEALGEHFGETLGHVLHDQNCGMKIRGNLRQNKLQRVWTARGNSDGDDAARWKRGARPFFWRSGFLDDDRRKFAAGGALGDFYFCDQLVSNFVEVAGGGVFWFCQKIYRAEGESFERGVATLFRMSAEENDRQGSAPHDEAKGLDAVHARHLEIEGHDIGLELCNFFQSECAVHGGTDNFDRRVARQDRGNQFPHESGIIDDEDSDAFAHAMAPSGLARERREMTA